MRALVFKRYGRPDQIAFTNAPRPVPKPDEILVQVHAAGLNPIGNMIPKGTFKPILRFQLPATLGSDLAGVVVAVGSRVTRFKPGDAVFASIFDLGAGALAEFVRVPANAAALKPPNLDFVQAASIPMVGLTSWQAFKERARLKPGQKVFIPQAPEVSARSRSSSRNTLGQRWQRQRARGTLIWCGVSELMK
jgi:NADPH:quinone reductase-like Zn-dependent oxidoreductase